MKSKKQFTFELIYKFFNDQLTIFRDYLKKNFAKKFIKEFKSSIKYSIFFASKKNNKFQLCVDYRKLNVITIKNRTSLFNIKKLQNKLKKIKWFIKLNLKRIYNLIRIKTKKNEKLHFEQNTNRTNTLLCHSN